MWCIDAWFWNLSFNEPSSQWNWVFLIVCVCAGHFTHNWMQLSSGVSHFKELPVWLSQTRQLADETYFGALTHNDKHTHKDIFGASEEISEQSNKGSWVETMEEVYTSPVHRTLHHIHEWYMTHILTPHSTVK